MSALPEENHGAVADTATPPTDAGTSNVRDLYAIPKPDTEADGEASGVFDRVASSLREHHTPPRVWTTATPSPAEELNRARHGTHLQSSGPLRTAAIGYSVAAGLVNSRDKIAIWVRSHPARMAVATVVLALLLASPARPIVAWILFGWQHLAFEALTD